MKKLIVIILVVSLFAGILTSCNDDQQVEELEKQIDELKKAQESVQIQTPVPTPIQTTEANQSEKNQDEVEYKEYIVKSGDTLSKISKAFFNDENHVAGIMAFNVAIINGDVINVGQIIKIPMTDIPLSPSMQPMPTPTLVPVATPTPVPVATPTPVPVATPTPAPVATPTPAPVATPTPVPVATPTPVPVAAPTPVPVATPTPVPVATPTPVPVATPTPVPVATPTPAPVATPTPAPKITIAKPTATSMSIDKKFYDVGDVMKITWNKVSNATSYDIHITLDGKRIELISGLKGSETTYKLQTMGKYAIRIYSVNEAGYTAGSYANFEVHEYVTATESYKVGDFVYVTGYAYSKANGTGTSSGYLKNKRLEISILVDPKSYTHYIHVTPYGWVKESSVSKSGSSASTPTSTPTVTVSPINKNVLNYINSSSSELGKFVDLSIADMLLDDYSNQASTKFRLVFSQLDAGIEGLFNVCSDLVMSGDRTRTMKVDLYKDMIETIINESATNENRQKAESIIDIAEMASDVVDAAGSTKDIFESVLEYKGVSDTFSNGFLKSPGVTKAFKSFDLAFTGIEYGSKIITIFAVDYSEEMAMLKTIESIYLEYASDEEASYIQEAINTLGEKYSDEFFKRAVELIDAETPGMLIKMLTGKVGVLGAAEFVIEMAASFSGVSKATDYYSRSTMLALAARYFKMYNSIAASNVVLTNGSTAAVENYIDSYHLTKYSSICYYRAVREIIPQLINYDKTEIKKIVDTRIAIINAYVGLEKIVGE